MTYFFGHNEKLNTSRENITWECIQSTQYLHHQWELRWKHILQTIVKLPALTKEAE